MKVKWYFENRFAANAGQGLNLNLADINFSSLSGEESEQLCKPMLEKEIPVTINQSGSTKSLDLNGYNFQFIKTL